MQTLFELMQKHNSCKAWDKFAYAHKFVKEIYPYYFDPLRDKSLRIIEIGVGAGGSIRAMQEYLPKAEIIGVDNDLDLSDVEGLEIEYGDQGDSVFMQYVADKYESFDIVIDDGSHKLEDQLTTFEALFPTLVSGGLYFIEDVMRPRFRRGARRRTAILDYVKDNWLTKKEICDVSGPPGKFQKIVFYRGMIVAQRL